MEDADFIWRSNWIIFDIQHDPPVSNLRELNPQKVSSHQKWNQAEPWQKKLPQLENSPETSTLLLSLVLSFGVSSFSIKTRTKVVLYHYITSHYHVILMLAKHRIVWITINSETSCGYSCIVGGDWWSIIWLHLDFLDGSKIGTQESSLIAGRGSELIWKGISSLCIHFFSWRFPTCWDKTHKTSLH